MLCVAAATPHKSHHNYTFLLFVRGRELIVNFWRSAAHRTFDGAVFNCTEGAASSPGPVSMCRRVVSFGRVLVVVVVVVAGRVWAHEQRLCQRDGVEVWRCGRMFSKQQQQRQQRCGNTAHKNNSFDHWRMQNRVLTKLVNRDLFEQYRILSFWRFN